MEEMRENRQYIEKRQRERYLATREAHKHRKEAKETPWAARDLFKNQVLHANLVTAQENESNFHAFTMTFCAMADKLAPVSMSVPEIRAVPDACIQPLPDNLSEGVVTGECITGGNEGDGDVEGSQEKKRTKVIDS